MMKKTIALLVLALILATGAAAAAPSDVGILNVERVMAESPKVKTLQEQLNAKASELARQLDAEKTGLSQAQFEERQKAAYNQFLQVKQTLEVQIDASIKQAVEQVAKEKKLLLILYKNSVAFGGVDITADVIAAMK